MMTMTERSFALSLPRPLWSGLLVLASILLSLGFACAVPLAAFAAIAALTLPRRDAFALIGAVWLTNQILGFAIHHYPLAASAMAWGLALGLVAFLSTLAAQWAKERMVQGYMAAAGAAFIAAFAAYEGSLLAISAASGSGLPDYAPSIVARIAMINAAAYGLLLVAYSAGVLVRRSKLLRQNVPLQSLLASGVAAAKADSP
jgi:hypothetical protein